MLNKIRKFMSNPVEDKEQNNDQTDRQVEEIIQEEFPNLEVVKLNEELEEAKDKYLRLFAEFDNYKRRNTKERFDLMRTAAQETISAILPVLDDFDRAKKNSDNGVEVFSEGIQLVYQKLYSILENLGLKAMDSNGMDFDMEYHDAITDIPAPTEDLKGKIIDTIEKGYILNDKIIRHAKVVVGK
jgi:molecular chaperone GrpE